MNRIEKQALAAQLKSKFLESKVAIFADYKGLTATKADALRKSLRAHRAEVKVLKNNIARLMVQDGALGEDVKDLVESMVGPTLVAFAYGDPVVVAKAVYQFAEDHEAFQVKESLLGRKRMKVDEVKILAMLPSREVLIGTVLGTLQAPLVQLVSVLSALPRSLLTVLSAIEKQKQDQQVSG